MTLLIENQIPDYLTQYVPEGASLDDFLVAGGSPVPTLSLDRKQFTAHYRKNKMTFMHPEGFPMQHFDCIIVGANANTTRTYYNKPFDRENPNVRPTCTSSDDLEPDVGVAEKQFDNCVLCPQNVFGTGPGGKGRACQRNKRIAVVPLGDIPNREWGGAMLLRLPPTSLDPYNEYVEKLGRSAKPIMPYLIVTRLSFDPEVQQQRLLFARQRWVTQDEMVQIREHLNGPQVKRILYISGSGMGPSLAQQEGEEAPPPHGAREVATLAAPVAEPPTQDQANRAAAARAAMEALAVEAELEAQAVAKANREAAAAAAAAVKPQAPPAFAPSTDHVGNGHDAPAPNLATNRTEAQAHNGPTVLPAQLTAAEAAEAAKAAAMARLTAAMAELEQIEQAKKRDVDLEANSVPASEPEPAAVDNAMIGTSELLGILDQRASIPD